MGHNRRARRTKIFAVSWIFSGDRVVSSLTVTVSLGSVSLTKTSSAMWDDPNWVRFPRAFPVHPFSRSAFAISKSYRALAPSRSEFRQGGHVVSDTQTP